jgi:hypothetical protein
VWAAVRLVEAAGEDVPAATTPPCSVGEPVVSTRLGECAGSLPVRVALAITPMASTPTTATVRAANTTPLRRVSAASPATTAAPVRDVVARCRVGGPAGSSVP